MDGLNSRPLARSPSSSLVNFSHGVAARDKIHGQCQVFTAADNGEVKLKRRRRIPPPRARGPQTLFNSRARAIKRHCRVLNFRDVAIILHCGVNLYIVARRRLLHVIIPMPVISQNRWIYKRLSIFVAQLLLFAGLILSLLSVFL